MTVDNSKCCVNVANIIYYFFFFKLSNKYVTSILMLTILPVIYLFFLTFFLFC